MTGADHRRRAASLRQRRTRTRLSRGRGTHLARINAGRAASSQPVTQALAMKDVRDGAGRADASRAWRWRRWRARSFRPGDNATPPPAPRPRRPSASRPSWWRRVPPADVRAAERTVAGSAAARPRHGAAQHGARPADQPRFVEAYMVGLNVEMARELLWRGFPTDQRGTYFDAFWGTARRGPVSRRHRAAARVGRSACSAPTGPPARDQFVLLLRSSCCAAIRTRSSTRSSGRWSTASASRVATAPTSLSVVQRRDAAGRLVLRLRSHGARGHR